MADKRPCQNCKSITYIESFKLSSDKSTTFCSNCANENCNNLCRSCYIIDNKRTFVSLFPVYDRLFGVGSRCALCFRVQCEKCVNFGTLICRCGFILQACKECVSRIKNFNCSKCISSVCDICGNLYSHDNIKCCSCGGTVCAEHREIVINEKYVYTKCDRCKYGMCKSCKKIKYISTKKSGEFCWACYYKNTKHLCGICQKSKTKRCKKCKIYLCETCSDNHIHKSWTF